ncbi:MAG: hypothetical protein KBG20_19200 [Caldilineaceae bacterium]|nr:hypothetical protein [Caldilineaceae bacterium]MBP8108882.1 hypothetical protein [Caldilineaceae bacterium]MBP8124808.1 hypothetical protein [Caldilineaceae bacterium]MBP9074443.1 hypothetical protein [Caldilineaceae bacterium]
MQSLHNAAWTRTTGIWLLTTVIIFLIGAFSAAYFRSWPLPSTPLDQLTVIANDRLGWTAQAVIFPLGFVATAAIFGFMAGRLSAALPRWLGIAATLVFVAGALLWLPISIDRLRLGAQAAEMIRTFDPASPPEVFRNSGTFWPHTLCVLAALGLMGSALALGGVLPTLGWVIAGLGGLGLVAGPLILRDWPPFVSYIFLLVMAIGLIRR